MDRHYAEDLDLTTVADRAAYSRWHFVRRFRELFAETPHQYLIRRRVERAKALLRDGVSVTEACMAVGFTSLGSFSSRFKELVGESPSAYRDRTRAEAAAWARVPSCYTMNHTRPVPDRATSKKHGAGRQP